MLMETKELLLEDRYSPITSSMGLIESPCTDVVKQFVQWQEELRKSMGLTYPSIFDHIFVKSVNGMR